MYNLKDEQLIKKQTYVKLKHVNSILFQPNLNVIKVEPYNFESDCFKVGAFLRQCTFIVTNHETCIYTVSQKNETSIRLPITLADIDGFLKKKFHC